MRMRFPFRALLISAPALGLISCTALRTEDAEGVLRRADQAMGATSLKTIRYAGSGTGGTFGQAYRPERLKLFVDRILPLHGRMAPMTELYAAIGRKP